MGKRGPKPYPDVLTPRQWEVLDLLRDGLSDQQIADRLGISLDGAKYHVSEILSKLGVTSRSEAAAWHKSELRPLYLRAVPWAFAAAAVALLAGVGALAYGVILGENQDTEGGAPADTVYRMDGASMEPTLGVGDLLRVHPYSSPVEVGDIIAFYSPVVTHRVFFKRVIAGPGDEIEIDALGEVRIYGNPLNEPYAQGPTLCGFNQSGCGDLVPSVDRPPADLPMVPDGGGNARAHSDNNDIEDPACARTGCYFVMGDNRQNSSDSRQGWLVPVENIIGYVEVPE